MSQAALDYVEGSDVVKALPAAEKLVLRQLAMLHRLEVNCAFPFLSDLARLSLIGGKDPERQCRRILQRLEKKGFILRHTSVRNNGSMTGNEYELLGLRAGMAVTEQMRQQMFTTPRTRVAAQLSLCLGEGAVVDGKQDDANGSSSSAVADANRSSSLAGANCAAGSADLAVEIVADVSSHPRTPRVSSSPRTPKVSALDVVFDARKEIKHPLPPLSPLAGAKSAHPGQEPRTTASATATATTSALRSAEVSMERAGGTSRSSGARVLPFARRRRDADPRQGLDADALLLYEITMNVLGECGVASKNVTRCQRIAVGEALRDEVERSGEALALVAARAITRWDEYLEAHAAGLLFRVVGVKRFFAEGYWLENAGHPWDWDKTAMRQMRGKSGTRLGMR